MIIRSMTIAVMSMGTVLSGCGQNLGQRPASAPLAAASDDADTVTTYLEEVQTPATTVEKIHAQASQGFLAPTASMAPVPSALPVDIGTIINLGKTVWDVIIANKPVVQVAYDYANALPKGVASPAELARFSDLQIRTFRYFGRNLFGSTVYDVTFTIVHQYGGTYNGKGKYLASVAVVPTQVDVNWAQKIGMKVTHVATSNVGTETDPIGAIVLELGFSTDTATKHHSKAVIMEFRGDRADVMTTKM